ncbi:MAG: hypothetical protein JXM73_13890 [Anaerolineae bacterium]|nr:hypothetical protein [Anaerolineae bacterium]
MIRHFNPAYIEGLVARNRLTDARSQVHKLLEVLPATGHSAIIDIYNKLCLVQGALENLLDDVPAHQNDLNS